MKPKYVTTALSLAMFLTHHSFGCEFVDHFHQVTAIRGRLVGKSLGRLQFRWLRQSFAVRDASLTLYEYRSPARISDLKRIAVIGSDSDGNFDFGRVAVGHYYLRIDAKRSDVFHDLFNVEVIDKVKPTESILIDISPLHPDGTGGHEFIERKTINAASH